MQYEKEPAEDHLGPNTIFYLYFVVLTNFLRYWVLLLVDIGMKMYIKVIRKRLLYFHIRVTWIILYF